MKKKKLILLLIIMALLPLIAQAQIKIDTTGAAIFGSKISMNAYYNPTKAPLFVTDTTGFGIATHLSTSALRLCTYNKYGYFTKSRKKTDVFNVGLPGGMRINEAHIQIYPNFPVHQEAELKAPISAPLQVFNRNAAALYVKGGYYTTSESYYKNYGAITIDVGERETNPNFSIVSCAVDASGNRTHIFFVRGDGTIYSRNGLIQSSDLSKKENVNPISPQSALYALSALHGVSFNYKENTQPASPSANSSTQSQIRLSEDESIGYETKDTEFIDDENNRIPEEVVAQMTTESTRKRIGLIAQEVEQVVPEVVRTLPDGSKGIMYTDLIALVIEGMKEIQTTVQAQSQRIDSLEQTVNFYKSLIPLTSALPATEILPSLAEKSGKDSKIASSWSTQVELYQNVPNPFTTSTEIVYSIPKELESCTLSVYDLNGQKIKQYDLSSPSGKVTISGNELESGTYIYTLALQGQILASRKMVKS